MGECWLSTAGRTTPPTAVLDLHLPHSRVGVSALCPCSQEPSPDNEGALHSSFCQLIEEQSSLVAGAIEMELQERSRGTTRNCSNVGWGETVLYTLALIPHSLSPPQSPRLSCSPWIPWPLLDWSPSRVSSTPATPPPCESWPTCPAAPSVSATPFPCHPCALPARAVPCCEPFQEFSLRPPIPVLCSCRRAQPWGHYLSILQPHGAAAASERPSIPAAAQPHSTAQPAAV